MNKEKKAIILAMIIGIFLLIGILLMILYKKNIGSCFYRIFGDMKSLNNISRDNYCNNCRNKEKIQFDIAKKLNFHKEKNGIVSTSIFGTNKKYIDKVLKNNHKLPEKWYIRIYLSPENKDIVGKFIEKDYEVFLMENNSNKLTGTCWRFLPLEDGEKFISIDSDDFDIKNFKKLDKIISKWSDEKIIVFGSSLCSPIMAGRWGSNIYFPVKSYLEKYDLTLRGSDELFIKKIIYNKMKNLVTYFSI